MSNEPLCPPFRLRRFRPAVLLAACLWPAVALAQERTDYLLGEQQGLEMRVHIIGEVQRPGEYRVPVQTDLLELLSKAGGPTQYSKLSAVSVRRVGAAQALTTPAGGTAPPVEIIRVDVDVILRHKWAQPPPVLQPGDVVFVQKNKWYTWTKVSAIMRDLAIVATAYIIYVRDIKNR